MGTGRLAHVGVCGRTFWPSTSVVFGVHTDFRESIWNPSDSNAGKFRKYDVICMDDTASGCFHETTLFRFDQVPP